MVESVINETRAFIVSNFLFGQEKTEITENQSFLESGIIDSTGLLELVSFVEQRFGVSVADPELLPENLDSLQNISAFIARKREAASA